ncbi:hypothetical protein PsorP6_012601 [Peronosclerospora sorghi]|uniref:Uncharacterized protein n=1 Tax=Peronosclerospora sorghi TaxID=230839 RepID=A0ACC0WGU6_9STRA|nr:hypothetical protein PsorP6_012601 [Peronosclerospora sorghi]
MVKKKKRSRAGRAGPIEKKTTTANVQSEDESMKKKLKVTHNTTPKLLLETTDLLIENARSNDANSSNLLVGTATKKQQKKKKKKKTRVPANVTTTATAGDKAVRNTKGNEIDDLFASLKARQHEKSMEDKQQKLAKEEEARRAKKENERLQQQIKKLEAQNTNSIAVGHNPDPRPVRYDEDGLPIYSEASLQIGKGGNTQDCPFDCWCCF